MKRALAGIILAIVAGVSAFAQAPFAQLQTPEARARREVLLAAPDLRISGYVFPPTERNRDARAFVVAEDNAALVTSISAATFALIAARFKHPAGSYNSNNTGKILLVNVLNTGKTMAGACRLILTVRKIEGIPAGRETHVTVPVLRAGKGVWLLLDASAILPATVKLESTTFKLNVDATKVVVESSESNNEVWHNLKTQVPIP